VVLGRVVRNGRPRKLRVSSEFDAIFVIHRRKIAIGRRLVQHLVLESLMFRFEGWNGIVTIVVGVQVRVGIAGESQKKLVLKSSLSQPIGDKFDKSPRLISICPYY